jgi:hypothetical protein
MPGSRSPPATGGRMGAPSPGLATGGLTWGNSGAKGARGPRATAPAAGWLGIGLTLRPGVAAGGMGIGSGGLWAIGGVAPGAADSAETEGVVTGSGGFSAILAAGDGCLRGGRRACIGGRNGIPPALGIGGAAGGATGGIGGAATCALASADLTEAMVSAGLSR